MLNYIWILPLLPLLGTLINGVVGLILRSRDRRLNKAFVSMVGVAVALAAFVFSVIAVWQLSIVSEHVYKRDLFTWIPGLQVKIGDGTLANFLVSWGFQLDPLSAVMILVVTGVGSLIHIYSVGYMWDDDGFYRFFAYLNLFMFAMLTLVLGDNFVMMFIGWEGVGLCSYLLIGYYLERKSAGDAAKKAFVVNRIGDFGFILGMLLIFGTFGSVDYGRVFEKVGELGVESGFGVLSAIALLLFVGAAGKSAQLPLYVWLPDAMEGPTPVSALIHAATMVTAGVYMVVRSNAIYSRAPEVMGVVAVVGVATALFSATIGLVQRDIKRVLAYSTVSQLGYMFTALGVGAFTAGIFHLMTHAFFKALLFLGAGSVIHGVAQQQDMLRMGGLKRYLPWTWGTMWVGTLAISGVPLLSGFFSKDEILWRAWSHGGAVIWGLGVLTAGLTAFYMFRLMFLTFHGEERWEGEGGGTGETPVFPSPTPSLSHSHAGRVHPHESPWVMVGPLVALAILSIVGGYVMVPSWFPVGSQGLEHFLEPVFEHQAVSVAAHGGGTGLEMGLTAISVLVALLGMGIAYYFYLARPQLPGLLAHRFRALYNTLYHKYYVDEIYDALVVNRAKNLGNFLWSFDANVVDGLVNFSAAFTRFSAWFSGVLDVHVVDRLVNLVASTVQFFSMVFRKLQTGLVQRYALFFLAGILLVLSLYLYIGA